jgi:MFS transporter, putative metabolite:H+ symporter
MLDCLEMQAGLTKNQYRLIAMAILCSLLEFYDFFMVGYVLAFVVGPWQLTYGQSAIVLLSSGVGAIGGAGFWGWLADRIGRRRVLIATIIEFSLGTGLLALTPDKGWGFLSVFRFIVGFGVGGLYCVILPLVQEFVPSSKRGNVGGLVTAAVPLGLGLGAVLGAWLGPVVGWRGLFALGLAPAPTIFLMRRWMPESPHWLVRVGRATEARQSLAWALELDQSQIPLTSSKRDAPPVSWKELFRYPRSLAVSWFGNLAAQTGVYGLYLWVPTLFMQVLHVTPARAAYYMIYSSAGAFVGRVGFSYLSDIVGRRLSGALFGFGAATLVMLAAYSNQLSLGRVSLFWLMMILVFAFADGGFAIVGPYAAEVWPMGLRATGMGSAYGFGGIGKIIGPLGLALIVGSSDVVKPEASVAKIVPAFAYLAAWFVLAGIVYAVLGFETKGLSIQQINSELD